MDDKEPGYYLAMQFSVAQGSSNWTTEAGPFATADAAIDATIAERDYGSDYRRCTLTLVDESGNSKAILHPRLEYKRQHDDWHAWHEQRAAVGIPEPEREDVDRR
ncbi:MAG: hypothetical protein ACYDAR_09430 [Thermomicrobiales bacterium]